MTNELTTTNGDLITFDEDKIGLIKRTIAQNATDDELALFLHQCQRTGLDPLARQIYFQKYNTSNGPQMTIITGIDGYRLVADRTGKYAGSDDPVFYDMVGSGTPYPVRATVTVWKIVSGQRVPFSASAYWDEYYPGEKKGHMWRKMPHVMLGKVAEAAALRKAFPADLSGVYTRDEMEQAWTELPEPTSPRYDDVYEQGMETLNAEDSRGAASPQAQAQRADKRPAAPNGNGVDWREKAVAADKWPTFASVITAAAPHYKSTRHVENALGKLGLTFGSDDNGLLFDRLIERTEVQE